MKCKRCWKISGVFKCCAATFALFSSYHCRIHRGRYLDEGMSQQDSRDDSKGPAFYPKVKLFVLTNVGRFANESFRQPSVRKRLILSYIFKYFDEGMSQKDSRDDSKGPASAQKFIIICIYISREAIHSKKIYLQINLRNLPAELLRSLRQNNFEKMIHFTIDSTNISAPFLRTAEHTFGITCIPS